MVLQAQVHQVLPSALDFQVVGMGEVVDLELQQEEAEMDMEIMVDITPKSDLPDRWVSLMG